ncbi:MAG: DUF1858 domain-containing protein [Carboxydocellales bacterium]
MEITQDMTITEVLKYNPKTADVFRGMGMHCLGCPSATGESVAGAARTHGLKVNELLEKLNATPLGEMSPDTAEESLPKGAIVQRDKKSFAVVPHIPAGIVTPDMLRKIADVAEKYGAAALKLTSGQRIAIVGLKKEEVEQVWAELGMKPGYAVGNFVRNIKVCPGSLFCKRGEQNSVGLGLVLDEQYHGMDLPGKLKMGISGCANNCAEAPVRDIGIVGTKTGWNLLVGGNVGTKPRIGHIIAKSLNEEQVKAAVKKIIEYYKAHANLNERLGELLERVGIAGIKDAVTQQLQ